MIKNIDFTSTFIGGEGDINAASFNIKVKELGLSDKVNYLGRKYGDEKNKYFMKADIFVFPTFYHNETFGLVNLEAMQFSLPIISTFEGGIPDVVQNGITGFLVKKRDARELAEKIAILIEDTDLRITMGERGRERFKEHFTLLNFEQTFCEIFTQITSQT